MRDSICAMYAKKWAKKRATPRTCYLRFFYKWRNHCGKKIKATRSEILLLKKSVPSSFSELYHYNKNIKNSLHSLPLKVVWNVIRTKKTTILPQTRAVIQFVWYTNMFIQRCLYSVDIFIRDSAKVQDLSHWYAGQIDRWIVQAFVHRFGAFVANTLIHK